MITQKMQRVIYCPLDFASISPRRGGPNTKLGPCNASKISQPLICDSILCTKAYINGTILISIWSRNTLAYVFSLHLKAHDHTKIKLNFPSYSFKMGFKCPHNFIVQILAPCVKWSSHVSGYRSIYNNNNNNNCQRLLSEFVNNYFMYSSVKYVPRTMDGCWRRIDVQTSSCTNCHFCSSIFPCKFEKIYLLQHRKPNLLKVVWPPNCLSEMPLSIAKLLLLFSPHPSQIQPHCCLQHLGGKYLYRIYYEAYVMRCQDEISPYIDSWEPQVARKSS